MSSPRDRSVDVINGALVKPLLLLSLPIIATNLMQVGYNIADTFWVGRLGQEAVSALTFSWAIIFLIITLSAGFTVAGTVLVAQNKGAGHAERVHHVAGQTIAFVVLLSTVFSAVGYFLTPEFMSIIGAVPTTMEYQLAVEYTRTMFLGIPFVFAFFIFQGLLQGWGDTRTPMYLMALGVFLNVIIDPFLILGFQNNVLFSVLGLQELEESLFLMIGFSGFGVQGAAFATIFSRGLGAFLAMGLLVTGRVGIAPRLADFVPQPTTVTKIIRIGAPASIEQSTRSIGVTILTALVALTSQEAVAAYGIGTRLTSLVFLPALGLARGTETVVGQNLGAGQTDRAKYAVYAATILIAIVLFFISFLAVMFATPITAIFITGENAGVVIDIGAEYLRIVGITFVFLGAFRIVQGGFRGSGSTRTAMIFSLLALVVFRVPPAYILVEWYNWGVTGVWYGIALSNIVIFVLAGLWFLRGTWVTTVIEQDTGLDRTVASTDSPPAKTDE